MSVTDDLGELPVLSTLQDLIIELLTEAEKTLVLASVASSPKKIEQEPELAPQIPLETTQSTSDAELVVQNEEVSALPQPVSDTIEEPIIETITTNQTLSSQPRTPKTDYKVKDNIKLELGEYGIHIIRKSQRINISDEEKGETFSIKSSGDELTGDWVMEHQEGFVLLKETPLWLHIIKNEQQTIIKIGHSILGLILDIAL